MHVSTLLSVISKIDGAYREMCRPVLEEFGLPQVSFDILMCLKNNPDCYTAAQISTLKQLKPNVVSLHVERLVQMNLLRREHVDGDRRKVRLELTQAAEPVTVKGRQMQFAFYSAVTEGLTKEELDTFRHCVRVSGQNAENVKRGKRFTKTEESKC